jgi:chromate transporter
MNSGQATLGALFFSFFKIGATGFGGPIALIALMEQEFVAEKKWMEGSHFHSGYLLCKLLPGPTAYQVALWIGRELKGNAGALIAGLSFLLPGFCLILTLSYIYETIHTWHSLNWILDGMRAGALVAILESCWRMITPYTKERAAWGWIFFSATLLWFLPWAEPLIILTFGLGFWCFANFKPEKKIALQPFTFLLAWKLYWTHFQAGAIVFGTGLAVLPFLEQRVVQTYHWLSQAEFIDGMAFGQITPGPITITSAFLGFRTCSWGGALAAFSGIYSPGILLILFLVPWCKKHFTGGKNLPAFQKGAFLAVLGCILASCLILSKPILHSFQSCFVLVFLIGILFWKRLPSWLLIPIGVIARGCFEIF